MVESTLSQYFKYVCISALNESELVAIRNCTCQGYQQIYECTIFGEGATVWRGSALDCPETNNEITLLHSGNSTVQGSCNGGALTATIIRIERNSYTSQLTVNVSADMIGLNITCSYDSGGDTIEIDSVEVTVTEGRYFM